MAVKMTYPTRTDIQIHHGGRWHTAGSLCVVDHGRGTFEYDIDYVFGGLQLPVSLNLPLRIEAPAMIDDPLGQHSDLRLPAFLYDLVPQGRGRRYLLDKLNLNDADGLEAALLLRGAFSPIGALRLASAAAYYEEEASKGAPDDARYEAGFALADLVHRSEDFIEHLALHSMLASGTTGVQGVAPKFLLATNREGRWFADMALPDELAHEHWLAKLPRGRTEDDLLVHRNEAAYLRLAHACGLRTNEPPRLFGNILLVRRFDRVVHQGVLHRLHQESAASLCDLRGFGLPARQQDLLMAICKVVDNPVQEAIEFIRRDVLNQAMRNTDNHARNTAVQRTVDGVVQLTPVFDFAPMFKDPELIARTCHWKNDAGQRQHNWEAVIDSLPMADSERAQIAASLADFASIVETLPELARQAGVDDEIIEQCRGSIDQQALQLNALKSAVGAHHG